MNILGYFEEWSRRPGETVRLAISTSHPSLRAVLERVVTGPGAKGESRVGSEERADILDVIVPGRLQQTAVGSYALLPLPPETAAKALSLHCWVWPTVPDRQKPQAVWSLADESRSLALVVVERRFELRAGDRVLAATPALALASKWYSVAVVSDATGVRLDVAQSAGMTAASRAVAQGEATALPRASELMLAGAGIDDSGSPVLAFNGKIETPAIFRRALDPAEIEAIRAARSPQPDVGWDIARDWASPSVAVAQGQCAPGTLYNGVERGVTGRIWNGAADSFLQVPQQYAALQFHEDDMVESGWDYDLVFTLPEQMKSGVYAVRLEAEGQVERLPLFIRGAATETAEVLLLMPTNSYLAYANEHLVTMDFSAVATHTIVPTADDLYLLDHPELGRSCYDTHSDGTPVRYSSRRRPLVNVRPGFPAWITDSYRHFSADLYFVEWLEKLGVSYHVATDEDLEREGAALLDKYQVMVTGSHPEYWTRQGRAHLETYLGSGGRLMYLGGNGFYWVTTRDPQRPWVIEIRRDNSGTRCWDAPFGERTHVMTEEQGGLWKGRGRGPHGLVGVGFCAEGWSKGSGFKRRPASYEGAGRAFFKGIDEEIVGDFGHILGGAAGDEIDRYDVRLGSPSHGLLLASSTPVGNEYVLVIEEQILGLPNRGGADLPDQVRADIVYVPIEGGGAVFSVGSITCVGAMAWNEFDNNMARLVTNALRILLSDLPE